MPPSLRRRAVRSMAWATVARAGEDVLHLLGRVVLARLLWPEAFGTFTLAAAVLAGVQLACQLQLGASVVQRAALGPDLRATAVWSLVGLGALGTGILLAVAGPVGAVVGNPEVAPVLRMISAVVVLSGASAAPRAWLLRELDFRRLALVGLLSEGTATAIGIAAAAAGAGVYSLAAACVAVEVVDLVVLWTLTPWRPHRHWRLAELAELVRFGYPLAGRRAVDYVITYGDRLLVGYALGAGALGLYALALRLVKGVAQGIAVVFERVAFPIFAHTQRDLARSHRGFLDALRVQAVLTFPAVIGVALIAPDLVPFALGPAWAGAVPLVQLLAFRVLGSSLLALPRAALTGRGRQWLVLSMSACAAVAFGLGWLIGLPWGVGGVAAGGAVAGLAVAPTSLWLLRRELPVGPGEWLRALAPAVGATAVMALGATAAAHLMARLPAPPVARLAVLAAAGAACYVLPLLPWLVREGRDYLRRATAPEVGDAAARAALGGEPASRG
jgi:PST family polysaccharide transporter